MKFTVLGSGGFIGSQMAEALKGKDGAAVYAPLRQDKSNILDDVLGRDLGHVFYCIGLTANFRSRPFDTVEAHVCLLKNILEYAQFESLTYLSSTRVYEGAATTHESTILQVSPDNPGHLYNLSKLTGESLCFMSARKTRVVRISNVFGLEMCGENFITQVMKEAAKTGHIEFRTSPESAKDYVSITDVVRWLPKIALNGTRNTYNIGSGQNVSNSDIALLLEKKGVSVSYIADAPKWSFPVIDTDRLFQEFGKNQSSLLSEFDHIYSGFINKNEVLNERVC